MTWRNGLLLAVVLLSVGGYGWMLLEADSTLRLSLLLLTGVFVAGTGLVFWHYRERLTAPLVSANLALGSIVHLALAGGLVGADRLWELGVVPAISANWHHFSIAIVGIGAAYVTWTGARGSGEVPARPRPSVPEPAPEPTPVLERSPDWAALAEQVDPVRASQVEALRRIAAALHEKGSDAALRVVHQEAMRLETEAMAAQEADDILTQAANLLAWGAQKLPELAELDLSDLLMAKAIADIRSLSSGVEHVFVSVHTLRPIHPITRQTAEDKCNARAEAARAALPLLRANGMRLSEDLIAAHPELEPFSSVTGFQVVEVPDGYVTFEGNGRREALVRAFGDDEPLEVEVRLYRFDDPETRATIRRRVDRVRHHKGVLWDRLR